MKREQKVINAAGSKTSGWVKPLGMFRLRERWQKNEKRRRQRQRSDRVRLDTLKDGPKAEKEQNGQI